uniref:Uncharacterized protein n=1 Tax=Citrus limon TaxID=2708 RepID=A0A1S8AD31_CITLI
MVEGKTSRIGERSTQTIPGDTSYGKQDLPHRLSTPVIGGQKIDVEKFDGKINFDMWRREVIDVLIQIDLNIVLKIERKARSSLFALKFNRVLWDSRLLVGCCCKTICHAGKLAMTQ